jgi:hypothetical protein
MARLEQYRAHRLEREEMVLGALRKAQAPATPAHLVRDAYPDVTPEVYPLAERSLLAHLHKLVSDGRAEERAGLFSAGSAGAH